MEKKLPISNGKYLDREGPRLEFKSGVKGIPNSVWDTYSSFANSFGGRIIIGIRDGTNEIEGVTKPEARIQDLWNSLNNPEIVNINILKEGDIWSYECDGKTLIIIDVPRADRYNRPVYHRRLEVGAFKRNGEGDFVCKLPDLAAMFRDKCVESFDSTVMEETRFDDMDMDSFHRFRNLMKTAFPDHLWNQASDGEFAEMIGATGRKSDRTMLTAAGLLMFGKEHIIYRQFPKFKLDYREYFNAGPDWSSRIVTGDGTWMGNVFNFYSLVMEKVFMSLKNPMKINDMGVRMENSDDRRVVRECIINSLVHAEYNGELTVLIENRRESITVSNSGIFRIPTERARKGGKSDPRNDIIAKMFSRIGLVERAGLGVNLIFTLWSKNHNLDPIIEEDLAEDMTTVILPNEPVSTHISNIDVKLMNDIRRNGKITVAEMAKNNGVSTSTVSNHIKILGAIGMIERVGGTRGYWRVV